MDRLPAWAKWTIISAGVLFSPALAFLLALAVGGLVVVIKGAGVAASLGIVGVCGIACVLVRRPRGLPRDRLSDT